jgi:hypothetical protein
MATSLITAGFALLQTSENKDFLIV